MDAASFTDVDAEVLAVQPPPSDAGIVGELLAAEDVSNDNDDAIETEDEPVHCPNRNELLQIIETMQKFSLFSKDGAIIQSSNMTRIIDKHFEGKSRQTTIRDYFQSF